MISAGPLRSAPCDNGVCAWGRIALSHTIAFADVVINYVFCASSLVVRRGATVIRTFTVSGQFFVSFLYFWVPLRSLAARSPPDSIHIG